MEKQTCVAFAEKRMLDRQHWKHIYERTLEKNRIAALNVTNLSAKLQIWQLM